VDILTWNIQSGLGCDKARDLVRIIGLIDRLGPPDIICLQEVARFFPEHGEAYHPDQLAVFAAGFPKYHAVWSTGMRWSQPDGAKRRFPPER